VRSFFGILLGRLFRRARLQPCQQGSLEDWALAPGFSPPPDARHLSNPKLSFSGSRQRFGWRGTTRAGYINARPKIIMLAHALSAQVKLVHAAIDHRRIGSAQVAAPAHSLGLRLARARGGTGLQSTGLKINSARGHQRSQGKQTNAHAEDSRIRVRTQGCRQEAHPGQHQETSRNNGPATGFLAHQNTFFQYRGFVQRRKRFHADHIGFAAQTPDDGSNQRSAVSIQSSRDLNSPGPVMG
jgi:hypothetical protein